MDNQKPREGSANCNLEILNTTREMVTNTTTKGQNQVTCRGKQKGERACGCKHHTTIKGKTNSMDMVSSHGMLMNEKLEHQKGSHRRRRCR
jgi:hypothetical protein